MGLERQLLVIGVFYRFIIRVGVYIYDAVVYVAVYKIRNAAGIAYI